MDQTHVIIKKITMGLDISEHKFHLFVIIFSIFPTILNELH